MAIIVLLVVAPFLVWLGYQLSVSKLRADKERLEYDRAALDAEWRQLDRVRRVRAVFLAARRAMRAEADRFNQPTPNDHEGGT